MYHGLQGERGHSTLGELQKMSVSQGHGTEWCVCVWVRGEVAHVQVYVWVLCDKYICTWYIKVGMCVCVCVCVFCL